MGKTKVYLAIGLSFIVVAAWAYVIFSFYQKEKEEKASLSQQVEGLKKTDDSSSVAPSLTSGESGMPLLGPDTKPLPVADDSSGSAVPIDIGDPGVKAAGSNEIGQSQNQEEGRLINADNWKTYVNKKYRYSFKYPGEYNFGPCDNQNPCKYGQVYEKDGGDAAWLTAATTSQNWPYIIIAHYENESFALPVGKKFLDWVKEKFSWMGDKAPKDYNIEFPVSKGDPKKGVLIHVPQTPQAYARDEVYFEKNGKIFQIQLLDSDKTPAQEFYNVWLGTFKLE